MLEKLGFSKQTSKNLSDSIEDFGKDLKNIATKIDLYSKASFNTLITMFEKAGKKIGFSISDFFADNKADIITALAVGLATATGLSLGSATIIKMVAAIAAALTLGKQTADLQSPNSVQKTIDVLNKYEELQTQIKKLPGDQVVGETDKDYKKRRDIEADRRNILLKELTELMENNPLAGIDLQGKNVGFEDQMGFPNTRDSRRTQLGKLKQKLMKERADADNYDVFEIFKKQLELLGDSPGTKNSNSPTRIPQSLLDIIGKAEGGAQGYNAANKGNAGDNSAGRPGLINMTVGEVMAAQARKEFVAAGKYQIIPDTLKGLVDKKIVSKDDTFNKETQDKLATALIDEALKRAGTDTKKQQYELARIFAAIADPNTGESYHKGVGNNKSSITTEQIQPILKNSGANISSLSSGLADGRVALTLNSGEGSGSITNNYNTNVAGSTGGKQIASAFSSDAADLFINKSFAVTA